MVLVCSLNSSENKELKHRICFYSPFLSLFLPSKSFSVCCMSPAKVSTKVKCNNFSPDCIRKVFKSSRKCVCVSKYITARDPEGQCTSAVSSPSLATELNSPDLYSLLTSLYFDTNWVITRLCVQAVGVSRVVRAALWLLFAIEWGALVV